MSRILFVLSPERGHINPCIGPASYLQRESHSVAFHTQYNVSEQLHRAGFETYYSAKNEAPPPVTANRAKYFAENIKDKEWCNFSLKTNYLDRVPAAIEPVRKTLRDFKPAIVVVDPKVYEGVIACELERIPWITLSPSLTMVSPEYLKTDLSATVNWFSTERDKLFLSHNVAAKFRFTDCLSSIHNLCFTTDELIGNVNLPDIKRIGPSLPAGDRGDECDFPWKKLDDRVPVVYVNLGTQTFWQPGIMRNLMSAVRDREVQLVCSVSALYDTLANEFVPSNVILVRDAPQLSLLPAMAAFVSHGGASSVMESIALGVPLIVCPFYDDQSHQAHFVDKCGVGQRQDLSNMDPDECWRALQFVLESPRIKETVAKVQFSYKKYDGANEAARIISRLASRRD